MHRINTYWYFSYLLLVGKSLETSFRWGLLSVFHFPLYWNFVGLNPGLLQSLHCQPELLAIGFITPTLTALTVYEQCSESITFWNGSGSADPYRYLWLTYRIWIRILLLSSVKDHLFFFFYFFFGGIFFFLFVQYSALLHLPPLRFHCADGCWDRTQDRCNWCIGSQTL
jgi:hypothetical protein